MKDEFTNRATSFKTARDFLHLPERKAVWFQLQPLIVTTKIAGIVQAIVDLDDYCQRHGVDITGAARDKSLEEADVENVGHSLCRPLYRWFLDHGNETDAAKCNLRLSGWQGLRDNALILKAREIRDLAIPIGALPGAADYGITSGLIQQFTDEINQYEALVNAPATSIAQKKALTLGLRAEFNKVERLYEALDDLILGFSGTAAGRDLIAAYKEARIIRDAGHGPATPVPTPPPVP